MKKLLSILAATGLVAITSATVVACGAKDEVKTVEEPYEGKTIEELKVILEEKKGAVINSENVEWNKKVYDYFISNDMGNYVEWNDFDFLYTKDAYDENDKLLPKVQNFYDNFVKNDSDYYIGQIAIFDVHEINYKIYLLDNKWETEITSAEKLIEIIKQEVLGFENETIDFFPLHNDTKKYTDKIIKRYS